MIPKELEIQLKKEVYRSNYFEFFKWAFKILFPAEEYVDTFHVKYLCDLLQQEQERIERKEDKDKDIIINIPPRSSKSLITSVCFQAWVWTRMPSATFIAVSFDADLSMMNAQLCKDIIKSDEYQELFGDEFQIRGDADAKQYFANDKGGFRLSKTVGGNITGHKGMYLLIDDPQNPKSAQQEVARKTVKDYYQQALYNRLTPVNRGVRIVIMQRLHEDDLTGILLKDQKSKNNYNHICLPAEVSDNINPPELRQFYKNDLLDPNRLSAKILNDFKTMLGSAGYAGQYSQRPAPEDGGIFKKEWFKTINPQSLTRHAEQNPIMFFIDGAYTEKTENDPTAILTCFEQDKRIYILDVHEVWMNFPNLCKHVVEHVNKFQYSRQYSKIFIEPKANGMPIIEQLRATTMLNVIPLQAPKESKVLRAHAITPLTESGRVVLVDGHYIDKFMSQLITFPNASHDDMVDVMVYSVDKLLVKGLNPDFLFI